MKILITNLTYTNQISLKSFNMQNILQSRESFNIESSSSKDSSFHTITKSDKTISIFLVIFQYRFVTCHVSRTPTIKVPNISSTCSKTRKNSKTIKFRFFYPNFSYFI
ncbi:hypothetical protein PanWU01x14_133720 [Parasponia andersonii]|uniref:Uncharacterized protein n=1 Tax=Parasponia andersonii TaxID=3476 RepID=A0A2P5CPX3_PARAD|nr:hypothetical protein PanWU01x14_133720 [Parasponia andersonii]